MSDDVNTLVPNEPLRKWKRALPQGLLKWKALSLQALGWKSKTDEQTNTFKAMNESCQIIRERVMRGNDEFGAEKTQGLLKGAGKEFKTYHARLIDFESADPRTPDLVQGLKAAAQAYIDHYNKHSKKQQQEPNNIAKKKACEATLKELYKFELVDQVEALGAPPWDNVQSMQAASLKTSLAISSLPPGEQRVEEVGGQHASAAFWIKEQGDKFPTFIFKLPGTSVREGYPDGGEPGREALSGRMAEMLNGALGLSLPVPETQVVSVAKESLPPESIEQLVGKGIIVDQNVYSGSVQRFEDTEGEIQLMTLARREQVPTQATQELAIFDTILLNTDRHGGNLLVKSGNNGEPELVPIDHGLCLPSRGSDEAISNRMGDTLSNALLRLPGSHQPFTQQARQSLAQLDPDALAQAMKNERAVLEIAHPSLAGTVSDECIELSRRSAMFLKRAASRLTPAAVQVGIARFNMELFAPDLNMDDFNDLADRIIGELEKQQDAIAECFLMPAQMQRQMEDDLAGKGWQVGKFSRGNSILSNPAMALRIWKSGIQAPSGEPEPPDPNRRPVDIDEQMLTVLEEARSTFPELKIPDNGDGKRKILEDWHDFTLLGGLDGLREAIGLVGVRGRNVTKAYENLKQAAIYLRQAKGLKQALANDNTDDALVDIRHSIEYINDIKAALEPTKREKVEQEIELIEKKALDKQQPMDDNAKKQALTTLGQLRQSLTDEARTRLLGKYKIYIDTVKDEKNETLAKQGRVQVEQRYEITIGYNTLKRLNPALADAS